ncbi:cytochrome bc1 complex Rieske iron-sulfur subunit [Subtercola frigoramans]|uniref:Cytochrome bc1 complex Rieske iron-sulfur subunit n=1 Tax=Subtercola frigoramans TaxID=120298 RepID=A0ABS2L5K7_9MICO|nr:Rieske 2Fe-2S domain-containing protein [Subtercola frigoramans]MBM7472364.1 ubiquinol-cytochrome c reductase iron-sulfur subunit [Subtercola frigoramans]
MAHDDSSGSELAAPSSGAAAGTAVERAGTAESNGGLAVITTDTFPDPGMPPHRPRVTDLDPKKARTAQRAVYTLFYLSVAGSVFALAAYMAFPIEDGDPGALRLNTVFLGLGITLALMGIGLGAVHWAKTLMADHEGIDVRHPVRGTPETRTRAVEIFDDANKESGFGRRTLIRNSLIGALVAFPLPAVILFRGLGPQFDNPASLLETTMWKAGARLTLDPSGLPIKASDVTLGSAFHIIPEGLNEMPDRLEQKAKAAVLLMRVNPADLNVSPGRETWNYDGIVAYSKICTHVGCPVALFEQQTHHLLCPCHQSTFDVNNECKVIFGPAKRALPQLPITVDGEGYLIAQSDFLEPVGPSFWERS